MNDDQFAVRQLDKQQSAISGQPNMRSGESWESMLKKYRLRNIADSGKSTWTVESESGSTYTVHSRTKMDALGSYYLEWSCNCAARRECRHITAVVNMLANEAHAAEDYNSLNEIVG